MATYRISYNPGDSLELVVTGTGVPTVIKNIELTINLANLITDANYPGGVRPMLRGEIFTAMKVLEQQIIKDPTFLD
jgi:hypothetical protein